MIIKKDGSKEAFSEDHAKLLYLLSRYTKTSKTSEEKDIWIKELPFLALIHHGIMKGVFNYDYAPASLELEIGRVFMNISQEAVDNIQDMREAGYIDCLKLSRTSHLFINGYKISNEGLKIINGLDPELKITEENRKKIEDFISCPKCGSKITISLEMNLENKLVKTYVVCSNNRCKFRESIGMEDIEDVSYISEPYLPRLIRF
ncbi:MAG: hypothetical protein ACTSWN_03970 [Promethearchaeota archaeon]